MKAQQNAIERLDTLEQSGYPLDVKELDKIKHRAQMRMLDNRYTDNYDCEIDFDIINRVECLYDHVDD